MEVHTRSGGDGVLCWNAEAISGYIRATESRQAQLVAANADLVATPGTLSCHGCVTLEYGNGSRCTAELTRTLYAVREEIGPRAGDASASPSVIPGFRGRIAGDAAHQL